MRNLSRAVFTMGVLAGVTSAASVAVVGCSGDDNGGMDSGKDTSLDQTGDQQQPPDGQPDSPLPDGGMDAMDGNVFVQFQQQFGQAFCTRFQQCCNGFDAGPFDYTFCVDQVSRGGVEGSNIDLKIAEIANGQNLQYDSTAAQACLAALSTLSCPIVASQEWKTLVDACMNAITGKLPVGGKCIRPTECQKGEYCNYAAEGGVSDGGNTYGLCANVLAQNAKCGQAPFGATFSYDECAYKGWQQPPRFCNYDTYPNPNGYFCDSLRSNGKVCYSDNECSSALCIDVTD